MDVESSVRKAAGGDLDAFGAITRSFQHMAFGYALGLVRDFRDAEDVVQEARRRRSTSREAWTRCVHRAGEVTDSAIHPSVPSSSRTRYH